MKFGEYLIQKSIIDEKDLHRALEKQRELNLRIGETLVAIGCLDQDTMEKYLEEHLLDIVDAISGGPEEMFQDVELSVDLL